MFRNSQIKNNENLKDLYSNMVSVGEKLSEITGLEEKDIYFEPGDSSFISYPCIIFEINNLSSYKASNKVFFKGYNYIITFITSDSTDPIIDKLHNFELLYFNGRTIYDNLYHYRFSLNGNVI